MMQIAGMMGDKQAKQMLPMVDLELSVDNSKTTSDLGIDFIPIKKSVADMIDALESTGYLAQHEADSKKKK